ncbi:hypothetical protein FAES_5012 [Fibrella aestuarina BUZ 2]|uniref:SMC domain protein n=1 Tax=Fibrella aestuarina BUZ 2 TaxID=1166018 RepID=I0KFV8_9BACT|nr:AAA family ATPase [Fibrella aestuarina]CCH03011.1 hypothetical protein FAES_5012 [Fibrella aestuarina BUZ 2]
MQIKRLVIENFKSIERIELIEPNPFTVFVGPNGSGKSTIFEALEFVNLNGLFGRDLALSFVRGLDTIRRRQATESSYRMEIQLEHNSVTVDPSLITDPRIPTDFLQDSDAVVARDEVNSFLLKFTRLFIGNDSLIKLNFTDDLRLTISASNLEAVLKRLLNDPIVNEEIHEWLTLFIPGFKKIEVVSGAFDSKDTLLVYEQTVEKPFTKDLISDGTYNIIALLTAVYQSEEPQFLCIEEPENGLHPQVLMSLIEFFRTMCAEKGHYIWLNTHSEAVVRKLTTDELILVNKVNGTTQAKQIKGKAIYDIPTDEAWLTGTLGGGLPW